MSRTKRETKEISPNRHGGGELFIELLSTRNTIRARRAKVASPQALAGQERLFFVSSPAKSPMVCWLCSQLQGKSTAHHSRPAPCLIPSFFSTTIRQQYRKTRANERETTSSFFGRLLHAHGNAFALPRLLSCSSQLILQIPARALDCISGRLVQ